MIQMILQAVEDASQLAIWSPAAQTFFSYTVLGIKFSDYYQKFLDSKNKESKLEISDINKESVEALRLDPKVDDIDLFGDEILATDFICIDFNRSLTSKEYDDFFDEEAVSLAYTECSINFEFIEINDNWDGICVELQDEYSRFEIAKFSVFIDKYLRSIGEKLYVEKVYM